MPRSQIVLVLPLADLAVDGCLPGLLWPGLIFGVECHCPADGWQRGSNLT